MKNAEIIERIDQMHGVKIDRMVWIAASQNSTSLSDLLEDIADNGELHNVLPKITEEDWAEYRSTPFELMVECGYLGFLAEVHFPTYSDFEFRTDGSMSSCSINEGCCYFGHIYAETLEALLDEMERQAIAYFEEYVKRAQRSHLDSRQVPTFNITSER